ncbi:tRNA-splicing endonuclease subunit Sen15 [Podarcis raffonei]|uniref:tRNA-splicing endonuclease subunit Sen15 n=1 Tax=Podarcis raffonei TaxID=65483 RepID=UPI0023298550|nr:tRNA-splicing endonuclease subunit Sen15 [Podarcis raffonei]XP_053247067.1 tRNA-splicing endonuclease subunit Sen15 [Podarcis raffonei]XP_053247069.1 tRNA-splicing endonuclease subunit Sen15 [Podarcis raffonei]XP_053247070.1 tRNA-splicing endonuclease subunit Sen15 [Podarcis raffonei]
MAGAAESGALGGPGSSPAGAAQSRPEEAARTLRGSRREDHPALTGMMSLEVAESSCVHAAFLVYLDLLEARNWHEVSYIGLAEFQLVCLCGRERETDGFQVVVPTPVHVSISHERLRQIMKRSYTLKDEPDSPLSITLAIVESDSTIVYYKLTHGFVTPEPPDDTEYMDDKQRRKKRKRFMRR